MAEDEANGLRTRIAVMESRLKAIESVLEGIKDYPTVKARLDLIALGLKGVVAVVFAIAVKYFFFSA